MNIISEAVSTDKNLKLVNENGYYRVILDEEIGRIDEFPTNDVTVTTKAGFQEWTTAVQVFNDLAIEFNLRML